VQPLESNAWLKLTSVLWTLDRQRISKNRQETLVLLTYCFTTSSVE
jgi:hypothetical protein